MTVKFFSEPYLLYEWEFLKITTITNNYEQDAHCIGRFWKKYYDLGYRLYIL